MEQTLKIVLAKNSSEIMATAKLCLKHRLYIYGWQLLPWYRRAEYFADNIKSIAVAYLSDIPVAALFVYKDGVAGIFVKDEERRKGIGTEMVKAFCAETNFVPIFTAHDYVSQEFFEGIEARIHIEYDWME